MSYAKSIGQYTQHKVGIQPDTYNAVTTNGTAWDLADITSAAVDLDLNSLASGANLSVQMQTSPDNSTWTASTTLTFATVTHADTLPASRRINVNPQKHDRYLRAVGMETGAQNAKYSVSLTTGPGGANPPIATNTTAPA